MMRTPFSKFFSHCLLATVMVLTVSLIVSHAHSEIDHESMRWLKDVRGKGWENIYRPVRVKPLTTAALRDTIPGHVNVGIGSAWVECRIVGKRHRANYDQLVNSQSASIPAVHRTPVRPQSPKFFYNNGITITKEDRKRFAEILAHHRDNERLRKPRKTEVPLPPAQLKEKTKTDQPKKILLGEPRKKINPLLETPQLLSPDTFLLIPTGRTQRPQEPIILEDFEGYLVNLPEEETKEKPDSFMLSDDAYSPVMVDGKEEWVDVQAIKTHVPQLATRGTYASNHSRFLFSQGVNSLASSDFKKADSLFKELVTTQPYDDYVHLAQGISQASLKRYDKALISVGRAFALAKKNGTEYPSLRHLSVEPSDYQSIIEEVQHYIEANPSDQNVAKLLKLLNAIP